MGNKGTCANCGRPISRNGKGGDWYHRTTASNACWPGNVARRGRYGRLATPVEVNRPRDEPA